MQASIQLTRFAAPSLGERQHAWPITVQARGINISSDIFVYRAGKQGDPYESDQFSCVASVSQLDEIPANRVVRLNAEQQIPWYRASQIDMVFRSASEAEAFWVTLQEEIALLVDNYNLSFVMQSMALTTVGGADSITTEALMRPPTRIQLNYEPAGVPTLADGVQDLGSPDPLLRGWLPASLAPDGWAVPPTAKFLYNIAQDPTLTAHWPLQPPIDGNLLFRDGMLLPYGVTHVFTADTIYWLDFDPSTVPGYAPAGSALGGNAPWPTDYVSISTPGTVSPIITIQIFA
jgi:hypothetical protein